MQNPNQNHLLDAIMQITAKTNPINKIFISQIIKKEYEDILTGGFENMIYIGEIKNPIKIKNKVIIIFFFIKKISILLGN